MATIEIDMVVADSLKALDLYQALFNANPVEVTDFPSGENEAVFILSGVQFHLLDSNEEMGMKIPDPDQSHPIWVTVSVPNVEESFEKAKSLGCSVIQEVRHLPDHGVSHAVVKDPYGYQWMLNEVHEEVSFEDRVENWENRDKE